MSLPEIPNSWIIAMLAILLTVMRYVGIDSWTTAALSMLIGYVTGKHIQGIVNPTPVILSQGLNTSSSSLSYG